MALGYSSKLRIRVPVGGEDVIFICRRPTAQEVSKFLDSRFTARRNKIQSNIYEARPAFIDKILLDIENAEYETASGDRAPLNASTVLTAEDKASSSAVLGVKVETWKDLVPLTWKSSAAMQFEDANQQQVGEDDAEAGIKN